MPKLNELQCNYTEWKLTFSQCCWNEVHTQIINTVIVIPYNFK